MKKKVLSLLLVAAMGLSMLVGCGGGGQQQGGNNTQKPGTEADSEQKYDFTGVEIKVWVAENIVEFTKQQIEAWKTANPEMKDIVVKVEPVGENDAAGNMITDVVGGADIYGFAQDQLSRLVAAGALTPISGKYVDEIAKNNDAGSVGASKVGDLTYAFPVTSDNGYFLYYDKSVVTDPTNLEAVLASCEAAGKNFYFDVANAWYSAAFFFAAGAECTFETDKEGAFVGVNCTYGSDAGLAAAKAMIEMNKSKSFVNGSDLDNVTNMAAIACGTWAKDTAIALLGDNYACVKLPTVKMNGQDVQLSGFGGFKLLGIKPQTDINKREACQSLASFLTSEAVQIARFNAVGWGPSNLNAQANEAIANDPALSALAEQLAFTIPQGQYPGEFWTEVQAFGTSIDNGEFDNATDEDILKALNDLDAKLEALAK